ncbi:bifunctional hydroxymethylpyrimidine kinase/phosphomethylpyrimidine kinase [uncultured Roseobacter sp.]|uniref:bifunctional hydroxymethylpyrimidine kinase/phosphomethylpyrimidine kinase n=1 Tax=uncultured Roseobacter sp. TaxID=114847 RepID=UPI0026225453|nr:bifunctional hydroxymethylpyrimidine kinase/phosphomethylpyrimidine kinase [uncultured Roseobacter sp.]
MLPNILSIAGSDPSGGAGIQADIKAISANGGYAMAVINGLTAQNTKGVQAVELVSLDMIAAQIASIRDDIHIDAIKIGMLGDARVIETVATALDGCDAPIVLDPVMVAKSGDRLLSADAIVAMRERLLPRAHVITPNLPEAADLLGMAEANSSEAMQSHGQSLRALGANAVLIKGGHLAGEDALDWLLNGSETLQLHSPRIATRNTHGTGCTLPAALATQIGAGQTLSKAAWLAKAYITDAIAAAGRLDVGSGHGPVHHFHTQQEGI